MSKLLESTKWGANLSQKEIETLAGYLRLFTAENGAVIVREGSREAYMCLMVEGRASVSKEGAGRARELGSIAPGHMFGEMSLIDGEPRSASVVAEEPCTLIVLTGDNFGHLSLEVPRLAMKVLLKISKVMSQRLRQTSGILVNHVA